jgi:cellulose synthase/poly-beta-1,6-N-acetylglucosamine synthase-like glycosyltransferase
MDMDGVFWVSAFVIAYTYLGYPLLLAAWARLSPRPVRKSPIQPDSWPSVSIVVAARNEAPRLVGRITNLLQLAYPGTREIIVVSDGSTDGTVDTLHDFIRLNSVAASSLRVMEVAPGGKPGALNAGVAAATGEILVFADARQRFAADALVELVANFTDPQVGGVTGQLMLDTETTPSSSSVGDGVGLYWKYEKWLRRNEGAVWSTLGATGAIYALRRSLWRPLPPDTLLDDVLAPMRAVLAGYRIVFEERAVAYDRTSQDAEEESRRKTRTLAGNYQILGQDWRLLVPGLNPVWLQYMSHKVGRLIVPWALLLLLVTSVFLARTSWYYAAALTVQVGFYALALVGAWGEVRGRRGRGFDSMVQVGRGVR